LQGAFGLSTKAHAHFSLDLSAVKAYEGVKAVYVASDLPHNDVSPVGKNDDPILAENISQFHGLPMFLVIAISRVIARLATLKAIVDYKPLEAVITMEAAIRQQRVVTEPLTLKRGFEAEATELSGVLRTGQQDHFYLETHIALALPQENGAMHVFSSTQHPSEVQHMVAVMLQKPLSAITVEVRRMGGGFGGKETQSNIFAVAAAFAASKCQKPVKIRPSRDDDMIMTGKRHDFQSEYRVGYKPDGKIAHVYATMQARAGFSADLSGPITDRALFHADNCYYYPHVHLQSKPLYSNSVSNTAFRGFGGPQGMVLAERLIEEVAFKTQQDPLDIRYLNLYDEAHNITPYHQVIDDFGFKDILQKLELSSDYRARKAAIKAFNARSKYIKKGLSLTPVKFGISFTATWYNQAGALVHLYQDGSILVNHGGTEMGQGLYMKVAQIVASCFDLPQSFVTCSSTRTDKVPNTSATAASSGADLNGAAAKIAALKIKQRLIDFIKSKYNNADIIFKKGYIFIAKQAYPFHEIVKQAYMARVHLSDVGFYKVPDIHWNRATGQGHPFYYFACGAACSEVSIDIATGENSLERVDILHDCGNSLNPALDLGQIEGGFLQGVGWLTTEEVVYSEAGKLLTHAPSTYKIPVASNRAKEMRVAFYDNPKKLDTVYHSKAVGEPPLMLAISVLQALSDAIASTRDYQFCPQLDAPATPEKILMAIERLKHL
jgi:xanthine dehydrogenase large subunit